MVGEIGEADEAEFLSGAHALLFPIDWPEPFGLVMIEATACRTPVIAFEGGSVREVVEEGATGFVRDVAGAVAAVARLSELSRAAVRRRLRGTFHRPTNGARLPRVVPPVGGQGAQLEEAQAHQCYGQGK